MCILDHLITKLMMRSLLVPGLVDWCCHDISRLWFWWWRHTSWLWVDGNEQKSFVFIKTKRSASRWFLEWAASRPCVAFQALRM